MSAGLPTGTVTFLFTDIEGSTKRWEARPDAMRAALARHDDILREAVEAQGGHVFKTVGDAFCAAFADPTNALNAAIIAQQGLHSADWEGNVGVLVRMALHTGVVEAQGGDYYGQPLNRVARLMSAGHGSQILLSQPAYELVRDNLPAGAQLRDMGEHRLKDLIRPEHIYQVVIRNLPSDFPPLKTLDYRPNNLPAQPTALIGREKELADIRKLLGREDVRLVTLTGPGGIGKTRLALQAAADLLDEYADGVWFVNLAPVTDHGLVVSTIAQTLDVKEVGGQALVDTLKSYLKEKHILLFVDNFEQVISAAPSISDLLATCPNLKVLSTSRIALRLRGEREYSVPALHMPDPKHMPALDALTQYEAVRLFIERAQGVKADFEVNNDNAPAVAGICARLDGLPLAIELAAARIKILPPQAMLTRLENRLKMLTGGARDLPARQQTIRNTIEWSYDLLDEGEKQLFRRMAVFQGGRTLEGLEAVCNSEAPQIGQLQMDVLDGLDSLISKSLVGQRQGRNGEPRYWMLETIHEFARLKLEESGEGEALARQHALYFMQMADRAEHEIIGPNQVEWLDMLEDEHDNIRAVLTWVRKQSQMEAAGEDEEPHPVDIGLRMVRTLNRFWVYRSYYTEGRMQITTIRNLEVAHDGSRARQAARAWAMVSETIFAHRQDDTKLSAELSVAALNIFREIGDKRGIASAILPLALQPSADPEDVRELLNESKALSEELGDKWNLARAYFYLGQHEDFVGNTSLSFELYSKGLALMQEVGDKSSIAHTYVQLGHVARRQGKYADAQAYYENGLALYRQVRDKWGTVVGLLTVTLLPWRQGIPDPAIMRPLAEEALDLSRQLGTGGLIGQSYNMLGRLALLEGSIEKARGFLEEGLAEVRKSNRAYYEPDETELIRYLGHVARIEGDVDKARALYEETLLPRYFEEANLYWRNVIPANTLPALASLEAEMASPRRTARMLGASEAFFEAGGELMTYDERLMYEESFARARARMGDEAAWQAAWDEGKAMSAEQAIAYALEGTDE